MNFADIGIKKNLKAGINTSVCPQCSHNRKKENQKKECLTIWNDEGNRGVNCNHCGWSLNLDKESHYEGIRKAAGRLNPPDIYTPVTMAFLEKKGISHTTARRLLICEEKAGVIKFPYYKNFSVVNVMFRDLNEEKKTGNKKTWQIRKTDETPTESCYWGYDSIDWDKRNTKGKLVILITEGQTDRATWYECGYGDQVNIISVPMGAPAENAKNLEKELLYAQDEMFLKNIKKHLSHLEIWLGVDNDGAGRRLLDALSGLYGKHLCKQPVYPDGYKDVNEVFKGDANKKLKSLGREGVERLFKSFKPLPVSGVIIIDDVWNEILDVRKNGIQRGLLCSNDDVNKHVSFSKQQLWIVSGNSGSGKSTWLRWYLADLTKTNHDIDLGVALYSPEMMPPRREFAKLMECYCQLPMTSNNPKATVINDMQLEKARAWVKKNFTVANPTVMMQDKSLLQGYAPNTVKGVFMYFQHLHKNFGTTINVIDAWNKLEHNRGGKSETDYISEVLDFILEFDALHNTTTIIIAHPKKQDPIRGKYNNPNFPIPTLYDISGSAHFKNKSHVGLILDRKKYSMTGDVDEDKQYSWEFNKAAATHLKWEKVKFEEIGEEGSHDMYMNYSRGSIFTSDKDLRFKKDEDKSQKQIILPPAPTEHDDEDPF